MMYVLMNEALLDGQHYTTMKLMQMILHKQNDMINHEKMAMQI